MKRIFFCLLISFISIIGFNVYAETYTTDYEIRVLYLENVFYTTNGASGITFEVLEKDTDKLVDNYTTDENGYIRFTLSTGEYIMNQVTVVDGYYLCTEIKLTVKRDINYQYIQAYLIKHNDEVIINNYDVDNNEISDSLFDVYDGDKIVYSNVKPFTKFKLNAGKYNIVQKSVSDNYSLNRKCYELEITGGGDISYRNISSSLKEVNIINEYYDPNNEDVEIDVPNTLIFDYHYLLYLACIPILFKHEKV